MLSPLKEFLREYQMVLASTSAQRKMLWQQMGLNYRAVPSLFDEDSVAQGDFDSPDQYVKNLAKCKASAVSEKLINQGNVDRRIIVGADTIIVAENNIIGKPHTEIKATETLERLSGKTHQVMTGVSIIMFVDGGGSYEDSFVSSTDVTFSVLSRDLILSYVATGEPLNKAGAYGIQGLGSRLVKKIVGDYYNVVGFPINEFCERLEKLFTERHCSKKD